SVDNAEISATVTLNDDEEPTVVTKEWVQKGETLASWQAPATVPPWYWAGTGTLVPATTEWQQPYLQNPMAKTILNYCIRSNQQDDIACPIFGSLKFGLAYKILVLCTSQMACGEKMKNETLGRQRILIIDLLFRRGPGKICEFLHSKTMENKFSQH
uniref:Uncharacterized protein n=1 Tax=Romanomermis culicivorax TaxID=13658 RepID=A0A915J770_ROMCU